MERPPFGRRRLMVGLAIAASAVTVAALAPAASAAPSRHVIGGSAPAWLGQAKALSDTPASNRVGFGVLLGMRNSSGAVSTLQSISDPDSANYGKWLSDAQFRAQYAPSASDVSSVRDWLTKQGFQVTKTLTSGMYIEASGTAAQIEKTFSTTVKNYSYRGRTVRSNSSALSFPAGTPAAVTGVVAGVLGIDQGSQLHAPADMEPGPPPGERFGVQPCSDYYGQNVATDKPSAYGKKQPYAVCGYGPQQYQSAYGESSLLRSGVDGRGVTVAITDAYAAPTILADAQKYNQVHGQPLFKPGQFSQITPGPDGYDLTDLCGPQGWYGEETLDVEAVHAMAPGAKVVYVGGADCSSGLDTAWAETIDNHVADVITNSWTDGTDDIAELGQDYVDFYTQFSLEAALTGITVNFSSGDAGDRTVGGTNPAARSVEFPADSPYVTGVGGTSVGIGKNGQWLWEHGWQSSYSALTNGAWSPAPPGTYASGGGGGTSVLYAQPFYQKGKVPASISKYFGGNTPMRAVPDISMPGDPNTGFLVGETQVFPEGTHWDQYRIGGTSLASPLLAGVIAVADQFAHRKLGFVNPLFYKLLNTPALHDITAPTSPLAQVRTNYANSVDNTQGKTYQLQTIDVQSTTIHSTRGYDDETGVGTPGGLLFFLGMPLAALFH
ncbi:S53 family peptidase [Rugosimonospora africana]|uniref:Serine protease n=1 Tax=Rugosimonospora africana TaxID=556532 RepID=A0A8J3R437_9ACTN|nr:S53 family peptidase [Rugosimonospora africana]GIH20975.1 serine protease [Rugosimonospora africana]